jgi:hypothetical protein
MKLKQKLESLRRVAPYSTRYGQLYRDKRETQLRYRRVTLWTLFVSDENEHMIRDHAFEKREAMTAREWHVWFSKHLEKIQRESVLPGIGIRTGLKAWAVQQVIGWTGDAKHASRNPPLDRKRHKAKRQRRKNG